jgi:hypothetical protein
LTSSSTHRLAQHGRAYTTHISTILSPSYDHCPRWHIQSILKIHQHGELLGNRPIHEINRRYCNRDKSMDTKLLEDTVILGHA